MATDGRQPLTGANIKYLLALDKLCQDKDRVRSVHIAEKLGITKPSVHTMLKTLREMGLIHKDAAGIHLTREGEALARRYGRYQALLYARFRALVPNDGDAGAAVTVLMAELPPDSLDVMCERLEWRRDNQLRMPAGSAELCQRL